MIVVRAVTRLVYILLALIVGAALFGRWGTEPFMLRIYSLNNRSNIYDEILVDLQHKASLTIDKITIPSWSYVSPRPQEVVFPSPDDTQTYVFKPTDSLPIYELYWETETYSALLGQFNVGQFIGWDTNSRYFYFSDSKFNGRIHYLDGSIIQRLNTYSREQIVCSFVDTNLCAYGIGSIEFGPIELEILNLADRTITSTGLKIYYKPRLFWSLNSLELYFDVQESQSFMEGGQISKYDFETKTVQSVYQSDFSLHDVALSQDGHWLLTVELIKPIPPGSYVSEYAAILTDLESDTLSQRVLSFPIDNYNFDIGASVSTLMKDHFIISISDMNVSSVYMIDGHQKQTSQIFSLNQGRAIHPNNTLLTPDGERVVLCCNTIHMINLKKNSLQTMTGISDPFTNAEWFTWDR